MCNISLWWLRFVILCLQSKWFPSTLVFRCRRQSCVCVASTHVARDVLFLLTAEISGTESRGLGPEPREEQKHHTGWKLSLDDVGAQAPPPNTLTIYGNVGVVFDIFNKYLHVWFVIASPKMSLPPICFAEPSENIFLLVWFWAHRSTSHTRPRFVLRVMCSIVSGKRINNTLTKKKSLISLLFSSFCPSCFLVLLKLPFHVPSLKGCSSCPSTTESFRWGMIMHLMLMYLSCVYGGGQKQGVPTHALPQA